MYLKRLEMQGFKSFANRTVLEFKPGITAVIGPNGSGKSNISDAIRWVLGEQSMKSLRGAKSEDVIFAGTQSRKSLGFAEVSIVFDNSDNTLPIEYDEVTVTRRLYRTGEAGYFINKVPCRLKDINELFMDTGIGKDGYSIIGQGRIDEILSSKSEDRRHIFEEAAGIVKYRVRKEESEKKLEQTKVNLMRINDILAELETNLEPLKAQSDKAKEYLNLREELKNVEVGLYLQKIDDFKSKIEKVDNDKKVLEEQNSSENAKLNEMQQNKENLKDEIDTIDEQIEKEQNLSFESKNEIEKINSNINISNERIENNKNTQNRLENEITVSNKNIMDLEEDAKNRELKRENLLENKEKFAKELAEKEEELAKLSKKLSTKELEIEDKKKQNEELTENKYEIQNSITMYETNFENLETREKQANRELEKIILELDEKRNSKNEIVNEALKIEQNRNKNKEELEKLENQKQKIEQTEKEYEDKIASLTDDRRIKFTKHNFLVETEKEKEGYNKSVKDILIACEKNPSLAKGVNGVLANIISTDEKYQTAIEMALAGSLQNIVTDTEEDAKKLIEFLRANKLGRASFLPISSIKANKLSSLKKIDGVIGVASELVKKDKKYENIVSNLLGRCVVTDNIETAIKLARLNNHSFKIVTLDGDIINASGSMTGGSVYKKTVNLLGRTQEIKKLEKEIKHIDKKLEEIVAKKEEFVKENESFIDEINEKTEELHKSEIEVATITEKKNSIEREIEKLVSSKEKNEKETENISKEKEDLQEKKKEALAQIDEITLKYNKLLTEINEFALLNKDDQKYIDNLNEDITNLKISVSSFDESTQSIDEMMNRIKGDIENEKKEIEDKKSQIEKSKEQNIELAKTIEELKNSIEKIKKDSSESIDKIKALKQKKIDKNNYLDNLEKSITAQFETIQKVKEGLVKADSKRTNLNQDLTDVINDLWNDYEITPNNAEGKFEKPKNIAETTKKVNELHEKIKELGSVNVDAIEEYKKQEERYTQMSEQRLDLETTISKLKKVIEEMTETMKKQFKEKFKLIQKNFNEVFVELFGGGRAELILEDEDNVLESGIEIKVEPAGKKLQNMMLLSGGERALTAISLLFAILKINPAPFCILDEIEAALDDVNVYRFANYLKKFSKTTQFLVITHRKGSMEAANTIYGVTMEENGISKLLSINLKK